ncbi:MAG: hypothetical protein ACRD9R_09815 [Pyrinomonadaceae bacterium]
MNQHQAGLPVALVTFGFGVAVALAVMSGRHLITRERLKDDKPSAPPACTLGTVEGMNELADFGPPDVPNPEAFKEEVQIADAFIDSEKLAYDGYVVEKRYKTVKLDYPPEMKAMPMQVQVSYAVLKRREKVLARFDHGIYFGADNSTRFGLFPFLGGDSEQLIVSQDIPRGGRQWIVSLSPRFRVIHEGAEFGVGREAEDMGVIDIDRDGVYEIIQPDTSFYGFSDWLPTGRTPLPRVIFKYDVKAGKYLPANHFFHDYLLKDISEAKQKVSGPDDRIDHFADTLSIVLEYVYAGRGQKAWAFYDEAYKLPDKTQMKRDIKAVLKKQSVYRFMSKKSAER